MRMRRFQAAQPFISELEDRITEGSRPVSWDASSDGWSTSHAPCEREGTWRDQRESQTLLAPL